jgi:uncharacterized membrane protein (UPF0127 family)
VVEKAKYISILNRTKATIVCDEGRLADTFSTRLFGLLGRRELRQGEGLLIKPSSGVHTFGMSFSIDIVALDTTFKVVGVWPKVGPWLIRGVRRNTRCVLELPPGQAERANIGIGDELVIQPG